MKQKFKIIVNNKGQQTAEFLLMLGSIVAFILQIHTSRSDIAGNEFGERHSVRFSNWNDCTIFHSDLSATVT